MNMSKIFNFIAENNISPNDVFMLVEKVKNLDLNNEQNIRIVIRDVAKLANRPLDVNKENQIVREIKQNGVTENLFNFV